MAISAELGPILSSSGYVNKTTGDLVYIEGVHRGMWKETYYCYEDTIDDATLDTFCTTRSIDTSGMTSAQKKRAVFLP